MNINNITNIEKRANWMLLGGIAGYVINNWWQTLAVILVVWFVSWLIEEYF